ncbi:MAG: ArnT family glycosyltransferase [Paracoccaceae bacterium]
MTGAPGRADTRPDARPDARPRAAAALALVGAVTLWRVALLAGMRLDLFVDESQYWLWSRTLDWGYYSKPPLIAWVIRVFTTVGGDGAFWIRLPGPLCHAVTALILGLLARRLAGDRAAFWTAAAYVTTPFAAMGSVFLSTDTVMAPFFALALLFWLRLTETRLSRFALLAGAAAGLAFLAKYAAVYALLGMALAAAVPGFRIGWRNAGVLIASFLVIAAPNLIWNATHGFATLNHTADNVAWVKDGATGGGLNPGGAAEFLAAQFLVFGPVLFAALLASVGTRRADLRVLALMSLPIVLVVALQALLSRAYANWAVAAYFAGTLLAVLMLLNRPALLRVSLALGLAVAVALPLLPFFPGLAFGDRPLLHRYLGRAALSEAIIAQARFHGAATVVAENRDVLADLFHTGRDSKLAFRALPPEGAPRSYYEQVLPLAPGAPGLALAVLSTPPVCSGRTVSPARRFETAGGAYAKLSLYAYVIDPDCLRPPG